MTTETNPTIEELAVELAKVEDNTLALQTEISTRVADFQNQLNETVKKGAEIREAIRLAMEAAGRKDYDDENLHITYVKPATRLGLDMDKLRVEMPEVIKKYGKTINVKSSIRIKVK